MLTFNAIDVETANADRSSICQIGIVHVRDGEIVDAWESLINPQTEFRRRNTDLHGITKEDVKDAPILPEIRQELRQRLRDSILISHGLFDHQAFEQAMVKYGLEKLQVTWLDSVAFAKRTIPGKRSYKLAALAEKFGINLEHHNALSDARTVAAVVLHMCKHHGGDIQTHLQQVVKPEASRSTNRPKRTYPKKQKIPGNPDGEFYGEIVVFTGLGQDTLDYFAEQAVKIGYTIHPNVTKKTTVLVLDDDYAFRVENYDRRRTGNHKRAERYVASGQEIKILPLHDFISMIAVPTAIMEAKEKGQSLEELRRLLEQVGVQVDAEFKRILSTPHGSPTDADKEPE